MRNSRTCSIFVGLLAALIFVLSGCSPKPAPAATPASAQSTVGISWPSSGAASHIGQRGTVCGPVVDSRYATGSKGKPTFLNFDKAYPNHTFVVLIWGSDRGSFPSSPETYYKGKQVCATGLIESYQGKPEIIAKSGSQLVFAR